MCSASFKCYSHIYACCLMKHLFISFAYFLNQIILLLLGVLWIFWIRNVFSAFKFSSTFLNIWNIFSKAFLTSFSANFTICFTSRYVSVDLSPPLLSVFFLILYMPTINTFHVVNTVNFIFMVIFYLILFSSFLE